MPFYTVDAVGQVDGVVRCYGSGDHGEGPVDQVMRCQGEVDQVEVLRELGQVEVVSWCGSGGGDEVDQVEVVWIR